jgi:YHS domain-containing protein
MNAQNKHLITLLITGTLILATISLAGCKKKEETTQKTETTETEQVVAAVTDVIEQTTCPIMGAPINKNLFTEYKGKKVYFCCPGCKEKFEEAPEQYLAKLPQFNE